MSTQQQIDDPGQWRPGDEATYEYTTGYPITGKLWLDGSDRGLYLGPQIVRDANGRVEVTHITVTRTVEPIPEPTVPWALVRFADGAILRRGTSSGFWIDSDGDAHSWRGAQDVYGAPVAVSLPHWSDEADGLRARVEKLADVFDEDAADVTRVLNERARTLATDHARDLRALLAEGGEA